MEKIKDKVHILIIVNIFITVLLLFTGKSESVNLAIVEGLDTESSMSKLKIAICKKAFFDLKQNKYSDYFVHPEVSSYLKSNEDEFFFTEIENFFFTFEGREVCRVVGKTNKGFIAYEAVISKDGPLIYRLTSLKSEKPTYKEVKEHI